MNKIEEARKFLESIGMPERQQADIACYTLLALAQLKKADKWKLATNDWFRIHDIIQFTNSYYDMTYAENSRETFRKQALHHFRRAAVIEDNGKPTNSPNYMYRLTPETLTLIKSFKSELWENNFNDFSLVHEKLINVYASKKKREKMPVNINNIELTFSPGKHNELQKAIIEEFAPRFAGGSECLYVGDTIKKDLVKNEATLQALGFEITQHDKMPDVVLYCKDKNWIYFIEAVTSVGPMDPKRIEEIKLMTQNVTAGKIFVTAFWDFKTYKKFVDSLAWDTEVWLAEMPEHMIHMNGDRFMGPRN